MGVIRHFIQEVKQILRVVPEIKRYPLTASFPTLSTFSVFDQHVTQVWFTPIVLFN